MLNKSRCQWSETSKNMKEYHDFFWGKPEYEDTELFALLSLELNQAGLSWQTILNKKEAFYKAFDNFNIDKVADYDDAKIEELLQNSGIIRHSRKIKAVINNAKMVLEIQKEFGSLANYLWNFTDHKVIQHHIKNESDLPTNNKLSKQISAELKKRGFKFVGSTIIYSYLQAIGIINDHVEYCFRYQELAK